MSTLALLSFFLSGCCALIYQMVWLRLAYAAFGITTHVMSVAISVFMLGLALGSWWMGPWLASNKFPRSKLLSYAAIEFLIGTGAFAVPALFHWGRQALFQFAQVGTIGYLAASGTIMAVAMLPWCVLMGSTIPLMMAYLFTAVPADRHHHFGRLYLANTLGAVAGTFLSAFILVELIGFRGTLMVAAALNWAIAALCSLFVAGERQRSTSTRIDPALATAAQPVPTAEPSPSRGAQDPHLIGILFCTGFCSMGLEVVWTRLFTPLLRTSVYAFAFILGLYLLGTSLGSTFYRIHQRRNRDVPTLLLVVLAALSFPAQLLINDPGWGWEIVGVVLSIILVSFCLGYTTPKWIDAYSGGHPRAAGYAYAVNTLGCIVGPLLTGYALVPFFGAKDAILILSVPLAVCALLYILRRGSPLWLRAGLLGVLTFANLQAATVARTYEDPGYPGQALRRDYSATVIALGRGFQRRLLVNGIGITQLTVITKVMAHLPLMLHPGQAKRALVICLGMGTTFRSAASWNLEVTAVELTPSVRDLMGYFFSDAGALLRNPRAHVVIDDGRRFLQRATETFDLITIDPPPPVEAAGSSLLYSTEFYRLASKRLAPDGILQQWYPLGRGKTLEAVSRSLIESFPHIVVYQSITGEGYHFLASQKPLPSITPEAALEKMPPSARADLMEWSRKKDALAGVRSLLERRRDVAEVLGGDAREKITDDQPYNEYFLLRVLTKKGK